MAQRNIVMSGATSVLPGAPVAAGVKILQGEIVQKNAAGYMEVGAAAGSKTGMGLAERTADNTGLADGATTVDIRYGGEYLVCENSTGADKVLITDLFSAVYINGANRVSRDSAGKSKMGICLGFEPNGDVRVLVTPS